MAGGKQQGQSIATIDKERRIGAALSVGMRVASAKFADRGYRYWHFDAHAGSGWNEAVNTAGSPLVFWEVAYICLQGLRPTPFFCDIDLDAMRQLYKRLEGNPITAGNSYLLPGDNQEALEVFAECIRKVERPRFATGSVVIDPNGWFYRNPKGIGAPITGLQWFCHEFLRIDTILNLNVRTYQMQKAQGHNVLSPREVLASLNKSHWLVSRAQTKGGKFLLAVGRNMPTQEHKALQLYDYRSEMGQYILDWAEGKRQGEFDVSQLSRVSQAFSVPRSAGGSDAPPPAL